MPPKHTDYITKLPHHEWKEVRNQLATGNHINEAKNYLSTITDNIRIFVTDGEGFGDPMFAVNIIEQLFALGYTGIVEIIAYKEELNNFLFPKYRSALGNILKLYNIDLFQGDYLFYTTPENITLHFYDYPYFNSHRDNFSEVEIGLFPGLLGRVYDNYYKNSFLLSKVFLSYFNVLNQLTFLAKSKRALYLNFYTATSFENKNGIGFALQLKGQQPKIHFLSHALSYPKTAKPFSIIQGELSQLKQKQPLLGNTLERIIELQEQNTVYTFAIYAIHHLPNHEYTLKNLLLSSKKAHAGTFQPLLVLLLSPISDNVWRQLTMVGQNATVFLDIINNQSLPDSYNSGFIYMLRLPSIPWMSFDYLFTKSTYPPIYEGINAASALNSNLKRGLPCPKPMIVDRGKGYVTKRFPVADHSELPADLALAGKDIICPLSRAEPSDYAAFLIRKYAGLSLPPGLPDKLPPFKKGYPELVFNITEAMAPLQIGNNRLAFALATVSQESDCETEFDTDYCRTPSAISACKIEFNSEYCHTAPDALIYLAHAPNAALRGFSYGFLEDSMMRALKTGGRLSEEKAHLIARSFEFTLKGYLEQNISLSLFLLAAETSLTLAPINPSKKKWAQKTITALLFMSLWLPQLFEFDPKEQCFSFLMTLISILTHLAGQSVSQICCQQINNFGFFSPMKKYTPDIETGTVKVRMQKIS